MTVLRNRAGPLDYIDFGITLPVRKESAAIMVAASTCITPDKEMNIKPVLTEPMPMASNKKEGRTKYNGV